MSKSKKSVSIFERIIQMTQDLTQRYNELRLISRRLEAIFGRIFSPIFSILVSIATTAQIGNYYFNKNTPAVFEPEAAPSGMKFFLALTWALSSILAVFSNYFRTCVQTACQLKGDTELLAAIAFNELAKELTWKDMISIADEMITKVNTAIHNKNIDSLNEEKVEALLKDLEFTLARLRDMLAQRKPGMGLAYQIELLTQVVISIPSNLAMLFMRTDGSLITLAAQSNSLVSTFNTASYTFGRYCAYLCKQESNFEQNKEDKKILKKNEQELVSLIERVRSFNVKKAEIVTEDQAIELTCRDRLFKTVMAWYNNRRMISRRFDAFFRVLLPLVSLSVSVATASQIANHYFNPMSEPIDKDESKLDPSSMNLLVASVWSSASVLTITTYFFRTYVQTACQLKEKAGSFFAYVKKIIAAIGYNDCTREITVKDMIRVGREAIDSAKKFENDRDKTEEKAQKVLAVLTFALPRLRDMLAQRKSGMGLAYALELWTQMLISIQANLVMIFMKGDGSIITRVAQIQSLVSTLNTASYNLLKYYSWQSRQEPDPVENQVEKCTLKEQERALVEEIQSVTEYIQEIKILDKNNNHQGKHERQGFFAKWSVQFMRVLSHTLTQEDSLQKSSLTQCSAV